MKRLLLAFALTLGFLSVNAQVITVENPNGGEVLYACQNYTITWSTSGTLSNYYDIHYSLDGGTIWASIATNYLSLNGQYSWTIPQVQSTTCLIRIRDAQNTTILDVSDAFFTINIPVTVLAPNGGETLQGGQVYPITWDAQGTSNLFHLYYSTNGGTSWTSIVFNYSTLSGTYNWTVPNIPSSNVLVRVRDASTACMIDQSDNPFTITPADPVLTSPNGAEVWYPSCTYNITWNTATFYSTLNLEYSVDNGSNWITIVTNTPNDGTHPWSIPYNVSSTCLVRASNYANTSINDLSDATFEIGEPVQLITPNGGETFYGCSSYPITWSKPSSCISQFTIQYSLDNGGDWTTIATPNNSGTGNTQNYNWSVPNGINSTQALIRVYNSAQPTWEDQSDNVFTISPSNDITVTTPNGGEVFQALTTEVISWTNLPSASGIYNIHYSINGGTSFSTIATNITGNNYIWEVPNNPSTNCIVRITDASNTCKFDWSDNVFTIEAAQPIMYTPNGGEVLNAGCQTVITWEPETFHSSVRLDYSSDNGFTWNNIVNIAANNGSYNWTPPHTYSSQYLVKVANFTNLLLSDSSDAVFTVQNPIKVTYPIGGEDISGCANHTITWEKPGSCISRFRVEYSLDNGATWVVIGTPNNSGSGNTQSLNWSIPYHFSTSTALVRVSNDYIPSVFDVSDTPFTITPSSGVEVLTPNGGENLVGCSSYTISWTKPGSCINRFRVEYSLNNGVSWTPITSPYNSGTGNTQDYNWNVPNTITSSEALIRVSDYDISTVNDVSDAVFNVNPSNNITVTSPNGGEVLTALTSTTITWTNLPSVSGLYNVLYSTNGGTSWTTLASSITGNGYIWDVPNIPSTNCLVRVIDSGSSCNVDVSDAVFTIAPPLPVLLSPNGGEVFDAGCEVNITWDPEVFYSSVRIDYSSDGGLTWTNIITNASNTGSRSWTPPYVYSSNYLIKVANSSNVLIADTSDATFTVRNPIEIVSPNGGEELIGCSSYTITWTKPGTCINRFRIEYSIDNGSTWNLFATPNNANTGDTQTQNWNVPNGINTTNALVRVLDFYNTSVFDASDAVFTINPSNDITVTSPNGGEVLTALTTATITWTNLPSVTGLYTIFYSTNGGTNWTTLASSITGNAYIWDVPNLPSTNCLIRVRDSGNSCKVDDSDAVFTIEPPLPVLLSPNGGEIFDAGCEVNITWDPEVFYSSVRIDYSSDGGLTWTNIITNASNTGSRSWTPPYVYSSNYLMKVANSSNVLIADTSDATFTVRNPIVVTSPNGGEELIGCNSHNITWTKPGSCITRFRIEYSIDNGATWVLLATPNNSGTGNTQTQNWNIPNGINTANALVRVLDFYNTSVFDVSDAVFTINPSNDITVTSPNGGEVFTALTTATITWTNLPSVTGLYTIFYSTNGGSGWTTIASNISGNAYVWNVPNVPSTNCLIRVRDSGNSCKIDESDAVFTIEPPLPVLLSPNGGEELNAGCATNITWVPAVFYSSVRVDYSPDGGLTWINISSGASNTGTLSWTPPYVFSNNYLIKVANSSNVLIADISDAPFTVQNPIEVTSPNGGEELIGCNSYNITWDKPGSCISRFRIEYSIDNGVTWVLLNTPNNSGSGNTQSYTWNIPNTITTTEGLVRVLDYYNSSVLDVSDANFSITPSNYITVTSPNGGEVYQGLSTTTITWTNTPEASGQYNIRYSVNGGTSWTTIATNVTGNAYVWNIPNNPSANCRIRVQDNQATCSYDDSDADFEITPAIPLVLGPNGGESFYAGTNTTITWDPATYYSNVRIDYSFDNGFTWNNIVTSAINNGSYTWSVPNVSSNLCLVRVSNTANLSINDESDNVFTIKAAVTVITPNGEDGITSWGGCTVTSITFDHTPAYNRWDILYSIDGGATWISIVNNWFQSANPATYNWNIPNLNSDDVLVRVRPNLNPSWGDDSDAPFAITKPVTIIQPNFGGIMQVGSIYNITWSSDGISNIYDILFSDNGGATWSTVVLGYVTSDNTYAWTVPNAPSTNCLIHVRDNIDHCKDDISDIPFTISSTAPALTVISPNGGESLIGCGNYAITWAESSPHGEYDIYYSTNSGLSWNVIEEGYLTGSLSYNWLVPNISSSQVLVKVKATGTAIEDLSDALLSIQQGTMTITTEDTLVCSGSPVMLNAEGAPSYSWSPTTGLSNPNIANPVATPMATTTYTVQYSNGGCLLEDQVTITTNTDGAVPVDVSIISTPSNDICSGDPVTFTASPQNEGATPSYQWYLNGAPVGTDSPSFNSSTLNDADEINVVLTSSESCITNNPATSNVIVMSVSDLSAPDVSISASETTVCQGTEITFTATGNNAGASPVYEWFVNGISVGNNSTVYASSTLANNDEVHVMMTSSSACAVGGPVSSNTISMVVNSTPNQPNPIAGATSLCSGVNSTYTVDIVPGATSYTWSLPSGWVGSSSTNSINALSGSSGGIISVVANNACGSSFDQSLPITVHPTANVTANASSISVCEGSTVTLFGTGAVSYVWTGGVDNGVAFTPVVTASYFVTGTDVNGCTDTDMITVSVENVPNVIANASEASLCVGESVTLTGSGASSYSWNNGVSNGVSFTPGSTQTYTVVGTAVNGCSASDQVTVVVNNLPVVSAGPNMMVCENELVTLSATGASSYSWDNGVSDGVPFSATNSGTYTVIGTDANGCSNTSFMDLTVNPAPTVGANASQTSVCSGEEVTLTGTGATSYSWDNGVSDGVAFAPSSTQTYTVTGTDGDGCSNAAQITVTVNPLPTVTANASETSVCPGTSVTLTGGGALSYTWSGGVVDGVLFTPSTTEVYTVTGTDANGCSNTADVTVSILIEPTVNAGNDFTVCENTQVTLTATGASSYSWDNGVVNGTPFTISATTTYTVIGTGANGCSSSDDITVFVNSMPNVVASATLTEICEGETVTLTGSGADNYSWDNSVSDGIAFVPSSTQTYTVTGTDGNGCSNTAQVSVTVNPIPTVTANASETSVCPNTSVTLTGGGALSYTWSGGIVDGESFIPSATDTYTVTGTDANGCSSTADVTVTILVEPTVNAGNDFTVCENTQVTLTATGASSYSWDNGVVNGVPFTATTTTTYTVVGTGANGCSSSDEITVFVNSMPNVVASASSTEICQGETVMLTGSGADNYSWNLGVNDGAVFVPSSTQTYTVTGTDGNGCSNTAQISVTVNPIPTVGVNASETTICEGEQVTLNGTGAQLYSWNNGVFDGVGFIPSATQTYTVTGTSLAGCTNTAQVTITVETSPSVTASGGGTICAGESITLTASGATLYTWNNGAGSGSSVTVSPSNSIIYTVTGTSLTGCTATDQVVVNVEAAPVLTTSGDVAYCEGGSTVLTVSGANDYEWNNGAGSGASVSVSPANTTVYTVTGTNTEGCVGTAQLTVTINDLPEISATGTSPICEGELAELSATGGQNYSWNNGAGNGAIVSVSPSNTTNYIVTGTDANGCSNTAGVTIVVNSAPTPTAVINESILQTGNYVTYQWHVNSSPIPGATSQTWEFTENGNYYVVVTDGNGCSGTSEVVVVSTVSIDEKVELTLRLYPNPTTGEFIVDFGQHVQDAELRIINAQGQLVNVTTNISGDSFIYSLDDKEPGLYFVEISAQGWAVVERVIKH